MEHSISHSFESERTIYVHVLSSVVSVNGEQLNEGDGATLKGIDMVNIAAAENCEALAFDLP